MPRRNVSEDMKEDMKAPIHILPLTDNNSRGLREAVDAANAFTLSERESKGRRTRIKISFEVWCRRRGGGLNYARLREEHITVSCPNSLQAKALVRLIQSMVRQLEGRYLAVDGIE